MNYRRRKFLINKAYQFKYSLFLIGLILVLFIGIALSTYYLVYPMLSKQFFGAITYTQAKNLANRLILVYFFETVIFIIFVFLLTIIFSHRIIGPVNRFKELVDKIRGGDFSTRIHLREHDEFKGLADSIDELLNKFEEDFNILKEKINELENSAKEVKDNILKENLLLKIAEIKKKLP